MLRSALLGVVAALIMPSTAAAQQPQPGFSPEAVERMRAEKAAYDAMPDTPGSGPYPAVMEVDPSLDNHVVYRPADLSTLGRKKLGVVLWGNGGCTDDGASARLHLAEIASHGYLVIAPGRIMSGPRQNGETPTPMTTTGADMLAGLDWALAENTRRSSRYYGRIDPAAVALSGHSCGGILSIQLSGDPRVKTLIIHNSGVFPNHPQRPTLVTDKAWLKQRLHSPILYVIGNESDVGHPVAMDDFSRIDHVPVFVAQLDVGHEGTFRRPNGGLAAKAAVAWLEWRLRGDPTAARMFEGEDCGLCLSAEWSVAKKGFR